MSSSLGQIGQNVADQLFETGSGAVSAGAAALTDIGKDSLESLLMGGSGMISSEEEAKKRQESEAEKAKKRKMEASRYQEILAEIERVVKAKARIKAETEKQNAQREEEKRAVEGKKKQGWLARMLNRAQTSTERGRMAE